MPKTESIADQNATELPLYTCLDAARYLHVPAWFVLPFMVRGYYHPRKFFDFFWHESLPRLADDYVPAFREHEAERFSFRSLAALFIYTAAFRSFFAENPFPWRHPKRQLRLVELLHRDEQKIIGDPKVFSDPDWVLDQGYRAFGIFKEPDRTQLLKIVALHQSRVERIKGVPIRLYPFSRDASPDAPRVVVIDPEIRFGRPSVKGVPTDVLVDRWRAGDNSPELADDYGLTTDEIDEALRYEAMPYLTPFHFPFLPFGW